MRSEVQITETERWQEVQDQGSKTQAEFKAVSQQMMSTDYSRKGRNAGLPAAGMVVLLLIMLFSAACRGFGPQPFAGVPQSDFAVTATPFTALAEEPDRQGEELVGNESTDSEHAAAAPETEPTPESEPEIETWPETACTEENGRLIEETYESVVLEKVLDAGVYLPPCYDTSSSDYPAVYFFHGSPARSADWVTLGIVELMDAGINNGQYPPAVLVFPLMPDEIFLWSDGGPGSYEEEFFLGLVRFIEDTYRVRPQADSRAVAGISRGGIWALEISMTHPDDFAAVASLSPALQYNSPRPEYDPFEILQRMDHGPQRLLLIAGDTDWARDETEALAGMLEEYSRMVSLLIASGSHETALWQNALPDVLSFLLSDWDALAY